MDSWVPWLASWVPVGPLNRKAREVILTILYKNPLEFRVAILSYQIRKMFLGPLYEGGSHNRGDGSGR
jgi:hypothetical protein